MSKEFFELIHPPIVEDVFENNIVRMKQDEEKGLEEVLNYQKCEEENCCCKLIRQISLFINPIIYKKQNDNKFN